ncbi:MAG TPA: RhtX/FptX family siderophore transporter [Pseudolabrys sp.]|nr:RhtX/FptX family siderophore transporter [Pseudolabrys sp.]
MGRMRLFVILAALYLAQSIPSYLIVSAMPPILREQGVSRTAIGFMSLLMLPLVLKFLWAPQVDRLRPLARAHRAGWVLITQVGVIAGIVALGFIDLHNIAAFMTIGMILSVLISTQDIATDGYATKALPARDRPIGNAIQGGSIAFGVLIGGTASLAIYHYYGWTEMIVWVSVMSLIPLVATAMMREQPPPGGLPPPRASLMAFLRRPEARRILYIALIYRASEGLIKAMEGAYLVDRHVPLDIIGYLSGGAALTAGLVGAALAAYLLMKLGTGKVLILLGGLRTICFLLFALHAFDVVTGYAPLFGAAAFQTLIRYMEVVALYSLFMAAASSDQPGTDFTVLACAQLVIYLIGSGVAGVMADKLGYGALFALATVLSGVAVVVTFGMLKGDDLARLNEAKA